MKKLKAELHRMRFWISAISIFITVPLFVIARLGAVNERKSEMLGGELLILFIPFIANMIYINIKDTIIEHRRMTMILKRQKVPRPTIVVKNIKSIKENNTKDVIDNVRREKPRINSIFKQDSIEV